MTYQFDYRPYHRHFCQPLNTSQGIWKIREGIILRLTDNLGNTGWGEVAPIPWFGSETIKQGLALCQQLGKRVTKEDIQTISDRCPACQFGFESALECLSGADDKGGKIKEISYSYLLPPGKTVLEEWEKILKQYPLAITLKWKIGVYPMDVEIEVFKKLCQVLPLRVKPEIEVFKKLCQVLPLRVKLRLDANGGLNLSQLQQWLQVTDKMGRVEFIEQPLSPQEFETMLALSQDYITPLALDESVATIKQLEECYDKGWRGIFVIKAAIAGSPRRLRQFISQHSIDVVFSSVFETKIGRQAALNLARELSNNNRAVGFGVNHWFVEDEDQWLISLLNNF